MAVDVTPQQYDSYDIDRRVRDGCRNQTEFDQHIAHQRGREEYERGVSPL